MDSLILVPLASSEILSNLSMP